MLKRGLDWGWSSVGSTTLLYTVIFRELWHFPVASYRWHLFHTKRLFWDMVFALRPRPLQHDSWCWATTEKWTQTARKHVNACPWYVLSLADSSVNRSATRYSKRLYWFCLFYTLHMERDFAAPSGFGHRLISHHVTVRQASRVAVSSRFSICITSQDSRKNVCLLE